MFEHKSLGGPWLHGALAVLLAVVALGCGGGDGADGGDAGAAGSGGAAGAAGGGGFESDDPSSRTDGYGGASGSAGTGGGTAGTGGSGAGEDAERAIEEADIIQMSGGRLYALSQYSGLTIIDVSVRDQLRVLGRYRSTAMPFEMILRGKTVIAMFSSFPLWVWDESAQGYRVEQTSRIVALDTTDAGTIEEIGSYDIPGQISDSRVVGDIFYVVSYEDGYCWNCEVNPTTTIQSLDVGDPKSIKAVDREAFQEDASSYGWTRRSVTVTQDRMYVAGIDWNWNTNEGHSTIQVVDISDPAGAMVLGDSVEVAGQIESRWQMDEHEGVLRVISQEGSAWGSGMMPRVETFEIVSSQQLNPLGSMEMQLPMPENLRSVRFDGLRAFAVTFEQTDPLFTLDLSDPANPVQLGELEIPGWLYHMEPRGDRLFALGFDPGSTDGSLTVSLFDVSDLSNPTMIDRVGFGGSWGSMAEDQDRIHKAFNILDQEGLMLVPFSGWSYEDGSGYGCGSYESGIQLIDFTANGLTKRGVAPMHGNARRAFLHDERMFAVSDASVATFDIADRDAPVAKRDIALSHNAVKSVAVGGSLVRIEGDWWTEEARLSVVPIEDPARDEPLGSINLSQLADSNGDGCYWSYYGFVYGSTLLAMDHYAVLIWNNGYYNGHGGSYDQKTGVAVIDVQDPSNPVLVSKRTFGFEFNGYRSWYYGYGGYGSALLSAGEGFVQSGRTIVLQERSMSGYYDAETMGPNRWHVLDLSDPAAPALAAMVTLPDALGQTPLQLQGDIVSSSRWEPVAGNPGKVRFYVDRVDISAPSAPQILPPVNVPGSLLARDAQTGRMATVDYRREVIHGIDYSSCYENYGYDVARWDSQTGKCVVMHRALKLVDVVGSTATLRDTLELTDGTYGQVALGEDRIFLVRYGLYTDYNGAVTKVRDRLMTVSGLSEGALRLSPGADLANEYFYWSSLLAYGKKVVAVGFYPGSVAVFDAANAGAAPSLVKSEELAGYVYDVSVHGDTAVCSLGPWGVQMVSLTE